MSKPVSTRTFQVETDGFYGMYYPHPESSKYAIIAMLGDSCEDYLAAKGVAWLHDQGLNVLAMSPAAADYSLHDFPLERFQTAIQWLQGEGNAKVGFMGASTTGMLGLLVASHYPDVTMTIVISPSDWVMEGYYQENSVERPGDNESTVTFKGKQLPYLPFPYRHPEHNQKLKEEAKRTHNMVAARELFDEAERRCPMTEDMRIKVEDIKGTLMLLGAEDDCLWDTCRYIRRMEKVLAEKPHDCDVHVLTYEHGTHFLFPQTMLEKMLPMGPSLLPRIFFKAARDFPKECHETRLDVNDEVTTELKKWMAE